MISNTINNDQTSRFIKEHFDVEDHYNDSMIDSLVDRHGHDVFILDFCYFELLLSLLIVLALVALGVLGRVS